MVIFLYLVCLFVCLFVSKSLLGVTRQWRCEKIAILSLKPRSHLRVLTWAIGVVLVKGALCTFEFWCIDWASLRWKDFAIHHQSEKQVCLLKTCEVQSLRRPIQKQNIQTKKVYYHAARKILTRDDIIMILNQSSLTADTFKILYVHLKRDRTEIRKSS